MEMVRAELPVVQLNSCTPVPCGASHPVCKYWRSIQLEKSCMWRCKCIVHCVSGEPSGMGCTNRKKNWRMCTSTRFTTFTPEGTAGVSGERYAPAVQRYGVQPKWCGALGLSQKTNVTVWRSYEMVWRQGVRRCT